MVLNMLKFTLFLTKLIPIAVLNRLCPKKGKKREKGKFTFFIDLAMCRRNPVNPFILFNPDTQGGEYP